VEQEARQRAEDEARRRAEEEAHRQADEARLRGGKDSGPRPAPRTPPVGGEEMEAEIRRQVEAEVRRRLGQPAPAAEPGPRDAPVERTAERAPRRGGLSPLSPEEGMLSPAHDIATLLYEIWQQQVT